jgi:hypothetical protein
MHGVWFLGAGDRQRLLQQPACRRTAASEVVEIKPVFEIVLRFPEPVPMGFVMSWI